MMAVRLEVVASGRVFIMIMANKTNSLTGLVNEHI